MKRWSRLPALLGVTLASCTPPAEPATALHGPAAKPSASASASARPAAGARSPLVGPHGEVAALAGVRVTITSAAGETRTIEPGELHPPPAERSLIGISPTALLFLDDGTLLVGVGDGTVTALDGAGHRRSSIGFRGAVSGLVPAAEGLVVVTTERGVAALITNEGKLRWERQITAERLGPAVMMKDVGILAASQRGVFALSLAGEPLFSHASSLMRSPCKPYDRDCDEDKAPALGLAGDEVVAGVGLRFRAGDPHPAVPDLAPTFPLKLTKVIDGTVVSLLATGPGEVSALVKKFAIEDSPPAQSGFASEGPELVRVEGERTTRIRLSPPAAVKEVFLDGTRPLDGDTALDTLVAGANGKLWVAGRRINYESTQFQGGVVDGPYIGAGQIFELDGSSVRERRDLFATFSGHVLKATIAAVQEGSPGFLCFGNPQPVCAVYEGGGFRLLTPPGVVTSVARIGGEVWLSTDKGEVFRSDGKGFVQIPQPAGAVVAGLAGASDKDAWATFNQRHVVLHWNGTLWTEVGVPVPAAGFFARAGDDVWSGRMHWDGQKWSLVHRAPRATVVLAKGKDDVWFGDAFGLWHGTAPGPSPVRLPPPVTRPDDGAAPAPTPLQLGAPDAHYAVERASIEVAGGAPLTSAQNVSASVTGVLWLQAWNRLVEVDAGGKATSLRSTAMTSFGRWAQPEGKGRGLVLERDEKRGIDRRDEVRLVDGQTVASDQGQLDHQDLVAIHGDPRGATWVVGNAPLLPAKTYFGVWETTSSRAVSAWDEFSPHALVRAGAGAFRPVLGLPSASWCDVAATLDGGAWFAGGLSHGPSGEGILFHAGGRLGSEATARFRAPAALLAVTAIGADEAWAVGAAGTIVHVKGVEVTRYTLASNEWLRAVFGAGPDDVWIAGDGGTLLHYESGAFHPVNHPLGPGAAFTGLAAVRGVLWAVGPSGILRIVKRP
jgi:hypothetical protein